MPALDLLPQRASSKTQTECFFHIFLAFYLVNSIKCCTFAGGNDRNNPWCATKNFNEYGI